MLTPSPVLLASFVHFGVLQDGSLVVCAALPNRRIDDVRIGLGGLPPNPIAEPSTNPTYQPLLITRASRWPNALESDQAVKLESSVEGSAGLLVERLADPQATLTVRTVRGLAEIIEAVRKHPGFRLAVEEHLP